jgi:hypothetical protein
MNARRLLVAAFSLSALTAVPGEAAAQTTQTFDIITSYNVAYAEINLVGHVHGAAAGTTATTQIYWNPAETQISTIVNACAQQIVVMMQQPGHFYFTATDGQPGSPSCTLTTPAL